MEFLRAGANVMQTFTFSASEENMESEVNSSASWLGDRVGGRWAGIMSRNENNLSMESYGTDPICYYPLLQAPHKISKQLIIM